MSPVIALATTFARPHLEYGVLWPVLVVFAVACVGSPIASIGVR